LSAVATFRKDRPPAAGAYEAEAAGLRWLADAGGARVVKVAAAGPDFLELEHLRSAAPERRAAADFGAALAVTHAAGAAAWGAPPDGYDGPTFIGRQPMRCEPTSSFADFYPSQRVLPYVKKAREHGHVDASTLRMVERACERIAQGDFDSSEPPARIHGDLWSGNVVWTPEGVVLIDPAAHGGHPETDLAMLALFGTPLLNEIVAGYRDVSPLASGWQDRVALHQLHPLAVHAASHGPSYAEPLRAAAAKTLAI
jgi:fructosamine-3-kinase